MGRGTETSRAQDSLDLHRGSLDLHMLKTDKTPAWKGRKACSPAPLLLEEVVSLRV